MQAAGVAPWIKTLSILCYLPLQRRLCCWFLNAHPSAGFNAKHSRRLFILLYFQAQQASSAPAQFTLRFSLFIPPPRCKSPIKLADMSHMYMQRLQLAWNLWQSTTSAGLYSTDLVPATQRTYLPQVMTGMQLVALTLMTARPPVHRLQTWVYLSLPAWFTRLQWSLRRTSFTRDSSRGDLMAMSSTYLLVSMFLWSTNRDMRS